ncbi:MAG: ABC transporter substrate-binding protein, partial [Syntrophomonadaceae bacterium]|nr:ABC transporter substrate-binding protein [Syntrophomonadaceae bacterium]
MKRSKISIVLLTILALVLSSCLAGCSKEKPQETAAPAEPEVRTIVDMAGREVRIPAKIEKAFSTSPVGVVMIYTLDPELLIGWNNELRQGDNKYLPLKYQNLPHLGGWYAKTTCNTEELLKIHPDIILAAGNTDQMAVSQAEQIQKQIGIPVVIISSDLDKLDKSYELAGNILNMKEQATKLGAYCRETVQDVQSKAQSIGEAQRIKVYYAEGPAGLQTEPQGSAHTRVIKMVGGVNVAKVPMKGGKGLTPVSLEQVL